MLWPISYHECITFTAEEGCFASNKSFDFGANSDDDPDQELLTEF